MFNKKPDTTLYCIIARSAPTAVIFRRGPSKQVLLIKWNLRDDTFEYGQWFKGRIYERRCDLSPSGEKLIYFAANFKNNGPGSWYAISKPPYLSALAMWPIGGTWGRGGLFLTERDIYIDDPFKPDDGFVLSKNVNVVNPREGKLPDYVTDYAMPHSRLIRDGWNFIQNRQVGPGGPEEVFDKPMIYSKKSPRRNNFILHMKLTGERHYKKNHSIGDYMNYEVMVDGNSIVSLPQKSWVDWDHNGDLLFEDEGKLFRLQSTDKIENFTLDNAKEIADFSDLVFEEKAPPKDALEW